MEVSPRAKVSPLRYQESKWGRSGLRTVTRRRHLRFSFAPFGSGGAEGPKRNKGRARTRRPSAINTMLDANLLNQ